MRRRTLLTLSFGRDLTYPAREPRGQDSTPGLSDTQTTLLATHFMRKDGWKSEVTDVTKVEKPEPS